MKSLKIDLDHMFDILQVELLPSLGHMTHTTNQMSVQTLKNQHFLSHSHKEYKIIQAM